MGSKHRFRLPTSHTRFLAGIRPVDPHVLRKFGPRTGTCTNDQRNWSTWGKYIPDSVLFEGQNAVLRLPTSHTGFLAGIRPVDPHVLGKPGLRAARCTSDQRRGYVSGILYMVGQENNSTKTCSFIYGRTRFLTSKSFVLGPGTRMIL